MTETQRVPASQKPKLLDRVRAAICSRHYSPRTEDAYVHWIKRFIFYHGVRHPAEMGEAEVTQFLSSLAVDHHVSASTQNQALSALLFLYKEVLQQPLPWLDNLVHARRPERLPVVLSRAEVRAILARLDGTPRLMVALLYGAGLRLLECCRLRVKDVDFASNQITVREGKGAKDRVTLLPFAIKTDLNRQLEDVRLQHQRDLRFGAGWVELPGALARQYPTAGREWAWQWIFPPRGSAFIQNPANGGATTCTNRWSSAPSRRPRSRPASPSRHPRMPSDIRLPLTCSRMDTIFGQSKSSWGIRTSGQP